MTTIGVSCGFHDAAVAVLDGDEILFAGHAERYSKTKHDALLNVELVEEALAYGTPETIVYYERPFLKKTRQWYSGESRNLDYRQYRRHIRQFFGNVPIEVVSHHEAHAAAGYYTSGFQDAAIIVVDAIGEWDTTSVWVAQGDEMKKIWSATYPDSIGLLYSALTKRCGMRPNKDEHKLMSLASHGNPNMWYEQIREDFIDFDPLGPDFFLKENVHLGIGDWNALAAPDDLGAAMQRILEEYLAHLFEWVAYTTGKRYLVFSGGVALNCVANAKLAARRIFDDIWIMPNPGDAGSSLGAALAYKRERVQWDGPYLGTDIRREVDIAETVSALGQGKICAIATGRAEFGPRALGNRSILGDPRFRQTKNRLNALKRRDYFQPFAACIREEDAHKCFLIPEHVASSP